MRPSIYRCRGESTGVPLPLLVKPFLAESRKNGCELRLSLQRS